MWQYWETAFKEVIKVQFSHKNIALSSWIGGFVRRERDLEIIISPQTHREKAAVYKPRRELLPEIQPSHSLILDFESLPQSEN